MTQKVAQNSLQIVLMATGGKDNLNPLIESIPSPLLPITNRPVMEIVIEKLSCDGFKQILVCLNHLAFSIESFFGDGRRWGVSLEYVLLRENWGTAGNLQWVKSLISGTFIVMPADILCDYDIRVAHKTHQAKRNLATAILQKYHPGNIQIDHITDGNSQNKIEDIYSETGIYIFEPQIIGWIPVRKKFDIHSDLLPALTSANKKIGAYITTGYWNPLNSFSNFQDAQVSYLNKIEVNNSSGLESLPLQRSSLSIKKIAPGVWSGRNNTIHPSIQLFPPVLLGNNIHIGKGVEIGPEVVIGDNVYIGDDVTLQNSTVFDNTYIGQLVNLKNRIVDRKLMVDSNTSEYIFVTDQFLLGETPRSIKENYLYRLFDIIITFFILIITFPLTLSIGLLQFFLYGKIFQSVPRIKSTPGQNGFALTPQYIFFYLLRFRTRGEDQQLTSLGKWLERTQFYRIPELWNVIKGDIRLVGVRPVAPEEVNQLTEAWQRKQLNYYPGFTGLWNIQNDCFYQSDDTLINDIYYVATHTWKEDLVILLKTPKAWINRITKKN